MLEITNNSVISRSNEVVFSKLDDEIMMMSIKNSEYYGLDDIGSRIWEILLNPSTFNEIIKTLLKEFEISEEECSADVLEFLRALKDKNLVLIS